MWIPPERIAWALQEAGFYESHSTKKLIEYTSSDERHVVYVISRNSTGENALVVHPERIDLLDHGIAGAVGRNEFTHSSNLRRFPERVNEGEGTTHYGFPFSFETGEAAAAFVKAIMR